MAGLGVGMHGPVSASYGPSPHDAWSPASGYGYAPEVDYSAAGAQSAATGYGGALAGGDDDYTPFVDEWGY